MGQPNYQNHWHLTQSKNELEQVDYNAIQRLGPDNGISKKIKALREEFQRLGTLVEHFGLDS